jgi:hypothetical protein
VRMGGGRNWFGTVSSPRRVAGGVKTVGSGARALELSTALRVV